MSDNIIERPVIPLPDGFTWGFVTARSIHAIADTTQDWDRYPEARGSNGRAIFTPMVRFNKHTEDPTAFVQYEIARARIREGTLIDAEGQEGIWLITGDYDVTFQIDDGSIPGFPITVTEEYTTSNPLDLVKYSPIETPPGYVEIVRIVDRERAEEAAEEAEGYAQDARQLVQTETFEGYIASAESARDSAQGYAQDSEQAAQSASQDASRAKSSAESIGDVEEGFREVKRMAERPLTKFEWVGEPHASESVKLINGVEVARNLAPNPRVRDNTNYWFAYPSEDERFWGSFNVAEEPEVTQYVGARKADADRRYMRLRSSYLDVQGGSAVAIRVWVRSPQRYRMRFVTTERVGDSLSQVSSGYTDLHQGWQLTTRVVTTDPSTSQLRVAVELSNPNGDLQEGDEIHAAGLVITTAPTEAEALAQVEEYFDGDTADNNLATESYVDDRITEVNPIKGFIPEGTDVDDAYGEAWHGCWYVSGALGVVGLPKDPSQGSVFEVQWTSGANGTTQFYTDRHDRYWREASASASGNSTVTRWGPWHRIASTEEVENAVSGLATKSYVDSSVSGLASESYVDNAVETYAPPSSIFNPIELGTTHMDDVQDPGWYYQGSFANMDTDYGYPVTVEAHGHIIVSRGYSSQIYQELTLTGSSQSKFYRNKPYGQGWRAWQRIITEEVT